MPKFQVTGPNGKSYEVDAKDAMAAYSALQTYFKSADASAPDPKQVYADRLDKIHKTQFPQMSDAQWQDYSSKVFAPNSLKEQGQQGQLFGLTDEIGAALGAAGSQARNWMGDKSAPDFGTAFGDYQGLEQSRRDLGAAQNGSAGQAMELIGGLSGFKPGAPVGNPSLLKSVLTGGAAGAGMGALYGAGSTDGGLAERGKGALQGGVVGGVLGSVIPGIFHGASVARGNLASNAEAKKAAERLGVSPGAARMTAETVGADGSLSPAGQARMAQAGQEAMLADAGPSARNMLDTAIQSSGKAGAKAQAAIDARVTRDGAALTDALDAALGTPQGVETTRAGIRTGSAAARHTAYERAYSVPIDYSSPAGQQLDELLSRVNPSDIEAANNLMKLEGHASKQILAKVADDGSITFFKKPDVRQIDYLTRALNDVADAGTGLGTLGGTTNKSRIYGGLSSDIRSAAKDAVPEYQQALETAADPIRRSKAVEFGSTLLRGTTTREAVANEVLRMTGPERDAVAQGVRSSLDDILANVKRTVMDGDIEARQAITILKELTVPANKTKLTTVIGKAKADALFAEIDRASKSFELRASVAQNSKTFMRQEMNRRVGNLANPDTPTASVLKGEPISAIRGGIKQATGFSPERINQRQDAVNQDIVALLTARGGQGVQTMQALQTLLGRLNKNSAAAQWLVDMGQKLSAPAAYTGAQVARKTAPWQ